MKHVLALFLPLLLCGCAAKSPVEARLPTMPAEFLSDREPETKNPPLHPGIAAWLEKRAASLALGERVHPPKGWMVLAVGTGDLNDDGREDLAVVLEELPKGATRPDPGDPGIRHLVVLLTRPDGVRKIAHANAALILDHGSGGVFGDPFEGIEIDDGALLVRHYGGSNFRWAYEMEFRYVDGLFCLTRLDRVNMYTGTGNGEETSCDFLRGTVQRRAWSGHNPERNEPLYSGKMENGTYLFDETDFDKAATNADIRFLPDLGYYDFDNSLFLAPLALRISPDEALERIRDARYPDLTEVRLPLTPAMKAAYAKLLGRQIAGRYFQDADGVLQYCGLDVVDDEEGRIVRMTHSILYTGTGSNTHDALYEIDDADGTIQVR